MEETGTKEPTTVTSPDGVRIKPVGEIVLDIVSILVKRRRFLVRFILIVTVLSGLLAAVSPKWYKGTATVFPAEQASLVPGLEGLSSFARSLGVSSLGRLSGRSEIDRYMAILKSESALMRVIERFDLTRVYEITSYPREKTMKALLANTQFEITEEGALVISVYDTDPQRAADMTNYFVQVLNETNSSMQAQNARANRDFIEQRVEKSRIDLASAEEELKDFQKRSGMFVMPEPSSSGVSAIAELYLLKTKKEVEIGILERTVGEDSPLLEQHRIELSEINKKVAQIPDAGMGTMRLYRNVVIQQRIMEFLLPLYEQAKVEEKRSTPSVVVLDHATVPERKAKPRISLYALIGFSASLLVGLFIVFTGEALSRLRALDPDRFRSVVSLLRSDWFGLRFKRGNER